MCCKEEKSKVLELIFFQIQLFLIFRVRNWRVGRRGTWREVNVRRKVRSKVRRKVRGKVRRKVRGKVRRKLVGKEGGKRFDEVGIERVVGGGGRRRRGRRLFGFNVNKLPSSLPVLFQLFEEDLVCFVLCMSNSNSFAVGFGEEVEERTVIVLPYPLELEDGKVVSHTHAPPPIPSFSPLRFSASFFFLLFHSQNFN